MDPNEALRLARESANEVLDADPDRQPDDPRSNAQELAEQFLALDEWLTKGGFKPSAWETTIVLNGGPQFAQRDFDRHADEAIAVANDTDETYTEARCVNCGAVVLTTTKTCGRCNTNPHVKDETV